MMMAVTTVISELKLNCMTVNGKPNKKGLAEMTFGIEISDVSSVAKAMNKIKTVPGVLSVTRLKNI